MASFKSTLFNNIDLNKLNAITLKVRLLCFWKRTTNNGVNAIDMILMDEEVSLILFFIGNSKI